MAPSESRGLLYALLRPGRVWRQTHGQTGGGDARNIILLSAVMTLRSLFVYCFAVGLSRVSCPPLRRASPASALPDALPAQACAALGRI